MSWIMSLFVVWLTAGMRINGIDTPMMAFLEYRYQRRKMLKQIDECRRELKLSRIANFALRNNDLPTRESQANFSELFRDISVPKKRRSESLRHKRSIVIFSIVFLLVISYTITLFGRWQFVSSRGQIYRLDHLTGEVTRCAETNDANRAALARVARSTPSRPSNSVIPSAPFITYYIAKARALGYSDDDIALALKESEVWGAKWKQALQEGYSDQDVYAYLGLTVKPPVLATCK